MTLEELLSNSGTIDFRLRVTQVANGIVEGYIHPQDRDGGTIDFAVKGNNLIVMQSQPSEDPLDEFRSVPFVEYAGYAPETKLSDLGINLKRDKDA